MPRQTLDAGTSTVVRHRARPLRMRVNMSAIGSCVIARPSPSPRYQDALRTPGIMPSRASLRKQMRQRLNLRYTLRRRPHSSHRRTRRVLNFGSRFALNRCAFVVIRPLPLCAVTPERESEALQKGPRFLV